MLRFAHSGVRRHYPDRANLRHYPVALILLYVILSTTLKIGGRKRIPNIGS